MSNTLGYLGALALITVGAVYNAPTPPPEWHPEPVAVVAPAAPAAPMPAGDDANKPPAAQGG